MINNLTVGTRLTLLLFVQLVILAVVVIAGLLGIVNTGRAMDDINQAVQDQATVNNFNQTLRGELLSTVNNVDRGIITWEQASNELATTQAGFNAAWQNYLDSLPTLMQPQIEDQYRTAFNDLQTTFSELKSLVSDQDRARLELFIINDMENLLEPVFTILQNSIEQSRANSTTSLQDAQTTNRLFVIVIIILAGLGLVTAIILGIGISRSIALPVEHMMEVVNQVTAGNYKARTELVGSNELTELGQAFNQLLQDRIATTAQLERENETLNNSVIKLLQAVSQLSQRDLTVTVPVTEDITGPVADALNLLTNETARVLVGVTRISEEVAQASVKVKSQSENVIAVAAQERQVVESAATELSNAAESMSHIATLAQTCNQAAETAIQTTQTALQTVTNTVVGINKTRDIIRETEKRIKRLGERSQEISGVVNLINTIAERTHILALNASMHAASAGEAGRGFAVVAEEVQRLAENAREATSQIATLVSNIQTETADAVNTMNTVISQVVEGSQLAEKAGSEMQRTQETTNELVLSVQQIATQSHRQAQVSQALLQRAQQIQQSTQQTSEQLEQQNQQTDYLVNYAEGLLNSVRVFKLPAAQQDAA